jgi:hypothetical protein
VHGVLRLDIRIAYYQTELGPVKRDNFNNGASTGAGAIVMAYQCDSAITEALTGGR